MLSSLRTKYYSGSRPRSSTTRILWGRMELGDEDDFSGCGVV